MQAIVFDQFQGPLTLETVADPDPPRDGVVVGVRACGLCRSDWHGWMGHDPGIQLPHVPGHELSGVVQEVGDQVTKFRPGDRVTVPFCVGCGRCASCRDGQLQVCLDPFQPGFTAWGAFAERVAIPHADLNLIHLPAGLDFVSAAALGCRYVTAYHALVAQAALRADQWLAVFGCGGVGLSAIQIGNTLGAQVLAVDVNPGSLEWARALGAQHTLLADAACQRPREMLREIRQVTDGGAHVSLDAVGSPATCVQAIRSLRPRGRHVQVGLLAGDEANVALPMHVVIARELQIIGSHGMSALEYPPLLQMIVDGRLDPRRLVAERVGLAEVTSRLPQLSQNHHVGVTVAELA